MNYSSYFPCDFVNGEGIRCTLFVSGCIHECKGCHNKKTWHASFGDEYTQELEDQIIKDLQDPVQVKDGLSLTGGDPMFPGNVPHVLRLMQRVKSETTKNIWLWTGFTLEQLQQDPLRSPLLEYIDVLVDGKYERDKRDVSLPHRGSSNQRIIKLS